MAVEDSLSDEFYHLNSALRMYKGITVKLKVKSVDPSVVKLFGKILTNSFQ